MERNSRIVALDFGIARIGVAITDERKIISSPLTVVETQKNFPKAIDNILNVLKPYSIEKIIIGLPLHLDGNRSEMSTHVEKFVILLSEKTTIPVEFLDERFTSTQAEKLLMEAKMNRKKRSAVIDKISAALLLQNYLEINPT